jgi:ABC-2 type transport system ATP-binding protein
MRLRLLAIAIVINTGFSAAFASPVKAEITVEVISIIGAPSSATDPNPVTLDADLYLPEVTPAPAVVLAHGFGGSKTSLESQAAQLQTAGYVVLAYTARGFGKSTGSISMNATESEIADASKIIDYLATRSEVQLDSANDPVVGFAGASYGGALSLMIAGTDQRVDAISSDITWNNLETALFPQNAITGNAPGVFKQLWTGLFFSRGLVTQDGATTRCGRFATQWCELYEKVATTGTYSPDQIALLQNSSPISVTQNITAPTLLMAGQADSLFPISEADATFNQIKAANPATPVKMIWHSGGHDGGSSETTRLNTLTQDWFDANLKKTKGLNTDFEVTFASQSITGSGREQASPNISVSSNYTALGQTLNQVALLGPPQQILAPAGGLPAGISTYPGIGSAGGFLTQQIPGQFAIFQTEPVTQSRQILGSSQISLLVSSQDAGVTNATLFVSLQIVSASGATLLPNGLVSPVKLNQVLRVPTQVDINLPVIAVELSPGDYLRVVVSTTDMAYRLPTTPAIIDVALAQPTLALAFQDVTPLNVSSSLWLYLWVILGALIIAGIVLFATRRRALDGETRPEFADVPVTIENLVKQFKNGPLAVNDISYSIPQGKVVGLLGPNGAGKTTTMRMVMGLIKPTSGDVFVFGQKVQPGSKVLSRIGSLVEGSGFLPHLTGRDNLDLYWRAAGRTTTANFDEVLNIADLGTAIDRKVRTYSQGMRQRLGIAQAMLGQPDLLILDEPTNGLDPQQIKEMRDVLHDYVATGKTVIISSHMLSEVEQTCSYVIVMHRGQLITAGEVTELLKSNTKLEDFFIEVVGEDLTIGKSS